MKDLLVQGEEHSKALSLLSGRAIPEAGPRFQTARGMLVWGWWRGETSQKRILASDRIALCDAHVRNEFT